MTKTCKYCSADASKNPYKLHEYCSRRCYHLYKRADNTGYLATHLDLLGKTYSEFHNVLRQYMPKFAMQSLKKIATYGINMEGGYQNCLPCEVGMKIACAIFDIDSSLEEFDYRRLYKAYDGFDTLAGANPNTNAFYTAVQAVFTDTKRFVEDFERMVNDAKERRQYKMDEEAYDSHVLYLDAKIDKVFRGDTWQEQVFVPYGDKRSIVILKKMLNYRVRYHTIAPVAYRFSLLFDVMGSLKLDPRFLLDEVTPNDAFRLRETFLSRESS